MVVALARFQAYYRSWIAVLRSALFGFGLGLAICSFLADHFFGSLSQWIQVLLFVLLACISSAVCGLITWGLRNELRVVYRRDREKKRMQREEKQKEKEKPENMVKERKGRHGKYMASNDGSARKDSGRSHHSTNSSARDVPPSMPQTQALIGGMSNVMIAQSGDADQMIQSTIDFADVESVGDDDLLGSHSDSDLRKLRGSGRRDSHSEHAQPEARHEERSSTWSLPHSSDEDNPGSKPKKGRIAEVKSGRRSSESSDSTKGSQSHPGAHIQGEDSDLVEHSPSTSEHTHDPDSISHGHSESIGSDADDPGSFHSVSDDHGVLISPKMVAGVNVHDDKGSAMHGDDLENTATSKIDKYDGEEEEEEEEEEDSKSSSSNLYGEVGRGMNTGDADSYDGYGYDEYSNNNEGKEEDWRNLSPSPSKVVNSVSTASGLCLAGISVLNLRVEHKMKEVLSEDGLDNRGDLLSPANQSRVQGMSRYGSLQEVNGQSTTKVNSSLNSPQHSLSEQSASSKNSKKSLVAKREIVHDVAGSESIYNSALASKFKDNYWVLLHQASLLMFSNQLMRSYFIVTKAQKQYDIARSKRWTKADVLTGKKSEERDRKTGRLVKRSGSFPFIRGIFMYIYAFFCDIVELDVWYILWWMKRTYEEKQGAGFGGDGGDALARLHLQKSLTTAGKQLTSAQGHLISLWQAVLHHRSENQIRAHCRLLYDTFTESERMYTTLLARFPDSPEVLRGYGMFLSTLKNDRSGAANLNSIADKIEAHPLLGVSAVEGMYEEDEEDEDEYVSDRDESSVTGGVFDMRADMTGPMSGRHTGRSRSGSTARHRHPSSQRPLSSHLSNADTVAMGNEVSGDESDDSYSDGKSEQFERDLNTVREDEQEESYSREISGTTSVDLRGTRKMSDQSQGATVLAVEKSSSETSIAQQTSNTTSKKSLSSSSKKGFKRKGSVASDMHGKRGSMTEREGSSAKLIPGAKRTASGALSDRGHGIHDIKFTHYPGNQIPITTSMPTITARTQSSARSDQGMTLVVDGTKIKTPVVPSLDVLSASKKSSTQPMESLSPLTGVSPSATQDIVNDSKHKGLTYYDTHNDAVSSAGRMEGLSRDDRSSSEGHNPDQMRRMSHESGIPLTAGSKGEVTGRLMLPLKSSRRPGGGMTDKRAGKSVIEQVRNLSNTSGIKKYTLYTLSLSLVTVVVYVVTFILLFQVKAVSTTFNAVTSLVSSTLNHSLSSTLSLSHSIQLLTAISVMDNDGSSLIDDQEYNSHDTSSLSTIAILEGVLAQLHGSAAAGFYVLLTQLDLCGGENATKTLVVTEDVSNISSGLNNVLDAISDIEYVLYPPFASSTEPPSTISDTDLYTLTSQAASVVAGLANELDDFSNSGILEGPLVDLFSTTSLDVLSYSNTDASAASSAGVSVRMSASSFLSEFFSSIHGIGASLSVLALELHDNTADPIDKNVILDGVLGSASMVKISGYYIDDIADIIIHSQSLFIQGNSSLVKDIQWKSNELMLEYSMHRIRIFFIFSLVCNVVSIIVECLVMYIVSMGVGFAGRIHTGIITNLANLPTIWQKYILLSVGKRLNADTEGKEEKEEEEVYNMSHPILKQKPRSLTEKSRGKHSGMYIIMFGIFAVTAIVLPFIIISLKARGSGQGMLLSSAVAYGSLSSVLDSGVSATNNSLWGFLIEIKNVQDDASVGAPLDTLILDTDILATTYDWKGFSNYSDNFTPLLIQSSSATDLSDLQDLVSFLAYGNSSLLELDVDMDNWTGVSLKHTPNMFDTLFKLRCSRNTTQYSGITPPASILDRGIIEPISSSLLCDEDTASFVETVAQDIESMKNVHGVSDVIDGVYRQQVQILSQEVSDSLAAPYSLPPIAYSANEGLHFLLHGDVFQPWKALSTSNQNDFVPFFDSINQYLFIVVGCVSVLYLLTRIIIISISNAYVATETLQSEIVLRSIPKSVFYSSHEVRTILETKEK